MPPEHVVFDMGRPFPLESGEAAHKLHESKSHQAWLDAGVHTRHLIKLKAEAGGKAQVGFYITFKIAETESADIYIIRNLHKTISKKFYDSWVAPADKGGWSAEKLEGKFKELVNDEPSPCSGEVRIGARSSRSPKRTTTRLLTTTTISSMRRQWRRLRRSR